MAGYLLLFLFGVVCSQNTQETNLSADIAMASVKGRAQFSLTNENKVSVTINVNTGQEFFRQTPVTVEIHPIWVMYDREDKCSNEYLGQSDTALSYTADGGLQNTNSLTVVFPYIAKTIYDIESFSIRLSSTAKTVCATIQRETGYHTAVATFRGPTSDSSSVPSPSECIFGSVLFRQARGSDTFPTRIVSSLHSMGNDEIFVNWRIVSDMMQISQPNSYYNPSNMPQNASPRCSPQNATNCPVGHLTNRLGRLSVGKRLSEFKAGFTDMDLSLAGSHSVLNKMLVIDDSGTNFAHIKLYKPRVGTATFHEDGVSGFMTFSQDSPLDSTQVTIDISGLKNVANGYHVHEYPRPVQLINTVGTCGPEFVSGHFNPYNIDLSNNYPPATVSTDDMYEIGDLSFKYGTMKDRDELKGNFKDWNLPLFGKNSILGRSVVIHRGDATASRWVCANIEPGAEVVAAVATFKTPVIGQVFFIQDADEPSSDTTIFARLDHLYDPPSSLHAWHIYENNIQSDIRKAEMVAQPSMCRSLTTVYSPNSGRRNCMSDGTDLCSSTTPLLCKIGELANRLGSLTIRPSPQGQLDNYGENFFTDDNLPLSGPSSIIGQYLVIKDSGNAALACAEIMPLHAPKLEAEFHLGSVKGRVSFSQTAGYGERMTTVTNNLSAQTLTDQKVKLAVYSLPPPRLDPVCSALGGMYNPLSVSQSGTAKNYAVGDLRRFGMNQTFSTVNLPLTGLTSIMGRSLVALDELDNVLGCAQLLPVANNGAGLPQLAIVSIDEGQVRGSATLYQMLYSDGTTSETTVELNFAHQDQSTSMNHNWHVHVAPIGNDAVTQTDRCMSAEGHYDPYKAFLNKTIYYKYCGKLMPLHCEVGDQAMKLHTYDIGSGRALFNDPDLPLSEFYSVLGRSLVFHVENRGPARLACADIIPSSTQPVLVTFRTPAKIDKRRAAELYGKAVGVDGQNKNVVVEIVSQSEGITTADVHFAGLKREINRASFIQFLSNGNNRNTFGEYSIIDFKADGRSDAKSIMHPPFLMLVLLVTVAFLSI